MENINENIEIKGIRINNISKIYNKYPYGCKSKKDFQALKNIFLEIEDGELFTLLGHNGAGKTTLINIMSGVLHPSSGQIFIDNLEISEDIDEIRAKIGVCP